MIRIVCPSCGESRRERLSGERRDGEIFIACQTCGHVWQRHPDDCPQCGKRSLVPVRKPLIQRVRGTQQSIIGFRIAKDCTSCGWSSEDS
ncbi:MAG TPA: hypothetical protein VFZ41_01375 [Solirubrobacterales bacterium]